ncbi:MAG: CPBP family intramembrane metalloprotease [Thermoplasmatales archaeon]|nr:MAG: CPBP family intramembrane metalloprotease [Thermoplasmatales archaeon]
MDFSIKKPTHIFALLVLLFTLFLLILFPILSFFGAFPSAQDIELSEPLIMIGSIITIIIFIGTPFVWYLLVNELSIQEMLSNLKIKKQGLDIALAWAITIVIIMFAIMFVIGLILYQQGVVEEETTNIQELASNLSLISMLFIVVFQSTTEEIFFRGFLLDKLNSLAGKEIAIITTAILFGMAHLSYGKIYPAIMTGVFGILLGYIVMKTKNLNTAIIAHILFNITSFALYIASQSLNLESLIL